MPFTKLFLSLKILTGSFACAALPVKQFPNFRYLSESVECGRNAVVLSGGIRFFKQEIDSFTKFIVSPNSADVFAHLYVTNATDEFAEDYNLIYRFVEHSFVKAVVVEQYTNEVEQQIKREQERSWSCLRRLPGAKVRDGSSPREEHKRTRNLSQLRKVFLAHQLLVNYTRQTGCSYRLVIRARPDITHRGKLQLKHFSSSRVVYVRTQAYWRKYGYMDDSFAIGAPAVMDIYSKQYVTFDALCLISTSWIPESFTTLQMSSAGIQRKELHHKYDFQPLFPVRSRRKRSPYTA